MSVFLSGVPLTLRGVVLVMDLGMWAGLFNVRGCLCLLCVFAVRVKPRSARRARQSS